MIFVTVGNYNPFHRLIKAVAQLRASGILTEDVILQVANMPGFESTACRVAQFLTPDEYHRCVREASVVICHAGAGNVIDALRANKVPVVMPRRKKYGEHVDDHQVELAERLAGEGRIILASEPEDLPTAIEQARGRGRFSLAANPPRLVELVSQAIDELISRSERRID
ncbi:MAG: glycosyltransferase [Candidatus Binataceae bacterium]